jgi:hypothetical protein
MGYSHFKVVEHSHERVAAAAIIFAGNGLKPGVVGDRQLSSSIID